MAEDKDVLFADLLGDFDVRTVQRADGQRAVQGQLHVAGTGRFFTGGRDLLGNIRRRDQHFSRRNAVVRQEHHLQLVAHFRIAVDRRRHFINGKDNVFAR